MLYLGHSQSTTKRVSPFRIQVYARAIGRAQLIRVVKTATGTAVQRLDFAAHGELRDKVANITTNEDLDHLFNTFGE